MDPAVLIGALLACVAAMTAVLGARAAFAAPRDEVLDRVKRVTRVAIAPVAAPVRSGGAASALAAFLAPLAALARPKQQSEDMSRIKRKLTHAGYRRDHAVEIFFGSKILLALLIGGGLFALSALRATPIPHARKLAVVAVAVGFYAPNLWLEHRARARQLSLGRALPDTLDLLVTCVEAGLGLDAALGRIAHEITLSAPDLAAELRQTTLEIQAGVARADALRRLAERTGLEELRALSAIVIQTEMFGTPVAKALRNHSSSMRVRRSHLAEERAATASVKMMVPLVLCILPSLLCVVLGPAIVRFVTLLAPALTGSR